MKLGLGSYSFRWSIGHKGAVPDPPMTALDVLNVAVQSKLDVVQFADNLPLHGLSTAELVILAGHAREHDIMLEVGVQGFDIGLLALYLSICEVLGSGMLRVALDAPEAALSDDELISAFETLIASACQRHVRIAVENHFNFPSRRLAKLVQAIDDPAIGICLDVANSICAGEWPDETLSVLAPHTINLHLKDYIIDPDPFGVGFRIVGVPLGTGKTDSAAILKALSGQGDISVILEHWLPMGDSLDAACALEHEWLSQSIAYARNELGLGGRSSAKHAHSGMARSHVSNDDKRWP